MSRKSKKITPTAYSKLNQRYKLFVDFYTGEHLFNGTQSCKAAGYKGSDNVLAVQARRLLRNNHIKDAIAESFLEAQRNTKITPDKILSDLEKQREGAIRDGQWAAANKATELMGKHLKMFADRVDHVHSIDETTTEDLAALLGELVSNIDDEHIRAAITGDGPDQGRDASGPGTQTTH